jgi:hypothetical protein
MGGKLGFMASTNLSVSTSNTIIPTTHIGKLPLPFAVAIHIDFAMETENPKRMKPKTSMIQPPWKTKFLIATFLMFLPFASPFLTLWWGNRLYMKICERSEFGVGG